MKKHLVIAGILAAAVLFTPGASADDLASNHVLVPVVGRTPGAVGSQWRTDLVVTNLSDNTVGAFAAHVTLMLPDGAVSVPVHLGLRETVVLRDVIASTFHRDAATGLLTISTPFPEAKVAARARIYNVAGVQGEYGQGVPGLPTDSLTRDHWLTGLSGTEGNRTNVGVSNPWDIELPITILLTGLDGEEHGSLTTVVPARSVRQINDIFAEFGNTVVEGSIRITGAVSFYAYASIVRGDSGDATFVTGTGLARGNENLVAPNCSNPAPVSLAAPGSQSAGSWIVMFRDGANATALTSELASRIGFTPTYIFENSFKGFSAELSGPMVADIRCESSVRVILENVIVPIP